MDLSFWSRDQRVLGLESGLPNQKERIKCASQHESDHGVVVATAALTR
jgi:hypothetical protein